MTDLTPFDHPVPGGKIKFPTPVIEVPPFPWKRVLWAAAGFGIALWAYSCDEDKKPVEPEPVVQEQTYGSTDAEKWQVFEREQRDTLYSRLMTTTGGNSLLGVLAHMPKKLSYLDKWHPPVRTNVGPLEYLFDLRPVNHKQRAASLSIRPDSYTLEFSLRLTDSPLDTYHKAVEDNSFHFPVKEEPSATQISQINMAPFYESVRNPTQEDLVIFYQFVQNHVPQFIVDAFYEAAVQEDIAKAREMIDADPIVYKVPYNANRCWDVVVDVSTARFSVQPTRYENGEIAFLDVSGVPVSRRGLILPEQWEQQPAFAKWLYRRGPQFTDNFEIMLDAYRTSTSASNFAETVLERIHSDQNV